MFQLFEAASFGAAIAHSRYKMAAKHTGAGVWFCLYLDDTGWVQLISVHETSIAFLDKHKIDNWAPHLGDFGLSRWSWKPAEHVLADSILQIIKKEMK